VPKEYFEKQWALHEKHGALIAIEQVRKHFKVSALVIARRALDGGLITLKQYDDQYAQVRKSISRQRGGDFYLNLGARNGKRFSSLVAELAYSGEIGLREASRLLNTTPTHVMTLYERQKTIPA
jgi:Zn-dependent peptidase ImmA (M78 family)